jgi:hypothetical protein
MRTSLRLSQFSFPQPNVARGSDRPAQAKSTALWLSSGKLLRAGGDTEMLMQSKWNEMCDAYANDEWIELRKVAYEFRDLLKNGVPPTVTSRDDLGNAFQMALAEAGVQFVLDLIQRHFTPTYLSPEDV